MPFWKCYYHLIWSTKNRQPLITPVIENVLFEAVGKKSEELLCSMLAINGTADHIHIAVCIRPALSISDWVGQVKRTSSHAVNSAFGELETKFRWQEDYGVVTFGAKNLPLVIQYIERQKEHHQTGDLQPYLETIEE